MIRQAEQWQAEFYQKYELHFIHLSDEFYCKSGEPLPEEDTYDGYLQIENGVGMMRLFWNEAQEELARVNPTDSAPGHISLVTAPSASAYIQRLVRELEEKIPGRQIDVHVIVNHFFGENITVTGLLTGQDIIAQLKGKPLGDKLLLPGNLLRAEGDLLLDDLSLADIEKALQIPVDIVKSSGSDFIRALL